MSRVLCVALSLLVLPVSLTAAEKGPPKTGDTVADFELASVGGGKVKLSDVAKDGPVVVVVLRGFPGYQCPLCRRQVAQWVNAADDFKKAGARVLMIYPGDVDDLAAKAKQFLGSKKLPDGFQMLLDPGYGFTNSWNLRWDAPKETAYPSTFVIGKDLNVSMARVSDSHGGRTAPATVLRSLAGDE